MQFSSRSRTWTLDEPGVGVVLTQTGDPAQWAPFRAEDGSWVVVAGRVVFDEVDWEVPVTRGSGGRAAGIVLRKYREQGLEALAELNGNCAVVLHDAPRRTVLLATDPCGVFPVFESGPTLRPTLCSHPDILAGAVGLADRLDETSLAEFVLTGTVSPPWTYYEGVTAAEHGSVTSFALDADDVAHRSVLRRHAWTYRGDDRVPVADLAEQLASAIRRAVRRRTHTHVGRVAVALSGGLDSRAILACQPDRTRTLAFTCFDEPNREFRTAQAVASALSVPFLGLQRGADYYADNAEAGIRISGGMGSFANNHFLGVMPRLDIEGVEAVLTGCYCDYLFKGLPLNRRRAGPARREVLAPFRHQFYFDHFDAPTPLAARARERVEARVPPSARQQQTPASVFDLERRRTFPLSYEGDNQQRLVPQRVSGWCPPFLDREVLDVYCRVPYFHKLDRNLFKRVTDEIAPGLRAIPDANTGAAAGAGIVWERVRAAELRVRRGWQRWWRPSASDESWPSWQDYVGRSPKLQTFWERSNPQAEDLFRRILGTGAVAADPRTYAGRRLFLFLGLMTVKLWLDQRQ